MDSSTSPLTLAEAHWSVLCANAVTGGGGEGGAEGRGGAYIFGGGEGGSKCYIAWFVQSLQNSKKTWGQPVCLFPGLESLGKMAFLGKVLESIGIWWLWSADICRRGIQKNKEKKKKEVEGFLCFNFSSKPLQDLVQTCSEKN